MEILHAVASGIAPALCASCGRSCRLEAIVCTRCGRRLAAAEPLLGKGPPGLDRAWSSAPHEGVVRNLVAALKFRHLLPVADLMADRIQWRAPAHMLSGAIVPAPPAPSRLRRRGFGPAGELAAALAERLEVPLEACLARRGGLQFDLLGELQSRRRCTGQVRERDGVRHDGQPIDDAVPERTRGAGAH